MGKRFNASYIADLFRGRDIKRLGQSVKTGIKSAGFSFKRMFDRAYISDEDGLAKSRRRLLYGSIGANFAAIMTAGVFFTGLILILLADEPESVRNAYLGNIVSIQVLCGCTQLFGPFLSAKLRRRRGFCLALRGVYYAVNIFGLSLVPFLPCDGTTKANVFLALVIVMQTAVSISSPALSEWHISAVPDDRRADYFALQQMIIPCINAVTSIICGAVIDAFKANGAELAGILLIRGLAVVFVAMETKSFFGVKEPEYDNAGKTRLRDIFLVPLRSPKFLLMVLIVFLWTFAANIPGQYFTAYLLKDAEFSYTYINFCGMFSIPILLIMMPIWNMLVHRFGWLRVMSVSLALYAFAHALNIFVTKDTAWVYIFCVIYSNLIAPGINLTFANLPYLHIPKEQKAACLAFYSAIGGGIAGFLGSFTGKLFIQATEGTYFSVFGMELKNSRAICLIPFAAILVISVIVFIVNKADEKSKAAA